MKKIALLLCGILVSWGSTQQNAPSPWVTSMIAAISEGNVNAQKHLRANPPNKETAPIAFMEVAAGLQSRPDFKKSFSKFSILFESRLSASLTKTTFPTYLILLGNSENPIAARKFLLKNMVLKERKLLSSWPEYTAELFLSMNGIVRQAGTRSELKEMALHYMGRLNAGESDSVLLEFAGSGDSLLRAAAYDGLSAKVVQNRHSGRLNENESLFAALKPTLKHPLNRQEIHVLILMNEAYATTYLIGELAPDPGRAIGLLLHGTNWEVETGLRLLAFFPDKAVDYENLVRTNLESRIQGIRNAALTASVLIESNSKVRND